MAHDSSLTNFEKLKDPQVTDRFKDTIGGKFSALVTENIHGELIYNVSSTWQSQKEEETTND